MRVQPGVRIPSPPDSTRLPKRRSRLTRERYIDGVLAGDRKMLARAITLIESSRADDAELAQQILEACLPHTGNSIRLGITGVPGAGKSTLIDALGMHLIRENQGFERIRRNQLKKWMYEVIERGLVRNFRNHPLVKQKLAELEREVTEGRVTSFRAANRLLELYTKHET